MAVNEPVSLLHCCIMPNMQWNQPKRHVCSSVLRACIAVQVGVKGTSVAQEEHLSIEHSIQPTNPPGLTGMPVMKSIDKQLKEDLDVQVYL